MLRTVLAFVCSLLAAGCGGGVQCTLVGCTSAVAFTLGQTEVATLNEGPSVAKVCVDANCNETAVDASRLDGSVLRIERPDGTQIDRADISLTITRNGTERFTRTWPAVKFAGVFPNGPACGEVCRLAVIDASRP